MSVKQKHETIAALEGEMIRRIRAHSGLSRVELARHLKLAPSTTGIYVDRLIKEGFLLETKKVEPTFGRPPTVLMPNPRGGRFLGVDFEAHKIMATSVDFSQQPIKQIQVEANEAESADEIISKIEDVLIKLIAGDRKSVLGIGVGVPGWISPETGTVVKYGYFIKGWENVPLRDRLKKRFKVPVYIENNIRSMALAELWFGEGRGINHFLCLGVRTGVAAGIVIDGHLYYGHDYLAGEVRNWSCPPVSQLNGGAGAGKTGWHQKLEDVASLPAILRAIEKASRSGGMLKRRAGSGPLTFEEAMEAARAGDEVVLGVLEHAAQTQGWAISQMCQLLSPERVIIAGPLTALGNVFLDPVKATVKSLLPAVPQIVNSTLGPFNGALGAAALALHRWKPARTRLQTTRKRKDH